MAKKTKAQKSWVLHMVIMSVAELEIKAKIWVPDLLLDSAVSNFLSAVRPLTKNLDIVFF